MDVCLEDTRIWEDDPKVLEGHHNVIVNSFFPHGKQARRVPIAGTEERALLGILERWARRDADARVWQRHIERSIQGDSNRDAGSRNLFLTQFAKGIAVSILMELRQRN